MKLAGSELSVYQPVEALQWKPGNINRADATSCVDRDESEWVSDCFDILLC